MLLMTLAARAQQLETQTVSGQVSDADGAPVPGAYIIQAGTQNGTVADLDGYFSLTLQQDTARQPRLVVSSIGFATREIALEPDTGELLIELEKKYIQSDEIVVSASRVEENIMQSPVTIHKMTIQQLRTTPSLNLYDAVTTMQGVDVMASSLTFKSINTRGFNSPANSRFVQRIDGVDMQTPGLNMPAGALNGALDLDMAAVEVIPGAASALYGPNAFNGLMNIQTKSPFQYPGLSARVRMGANHLNSPAPEPDPSPYYDVQIRYAKPLSNRVAFKFNLGYTRAQDWWATDERDVANYAGTANPPPGPGNPGYDGLNFYGDEAAAVVDSSFFPEELFALNLLIPDSLQIETPPTRIARTPYAEHELIDYNTYSLRGDAAFHYRFGNNNELILASRVSQGTTVLQADNRISMNNFLYHNHRLELQGERFFVRAYASLEDAGDSYDSRFAGLNVNKAWKSDTAWFAQYNFAYYGILDAIVNGMYPDDSVLQQLEVPQRFNDAAARAFADGNNTEVGILLEDRLAPLLELLPEESRAGFEELFNQMGGEARYEPGSAEFEAALEEARQDADWNTGARFIDRSRFYHTEGQYDLTGLIDWVDIVVGGSFRQYVLNSEGTVFADTAGRIRVREYGFYAQATRRFFDERVRITASGRYDKTENFEPRFTPRVAGVLSLGRYRQHNFRASYQTGFRMPELRHQWVAFNVGPYRVIGGFDSFFERYGLIYQGPEGPVRNNAYTLASVQQFRESGNAADLLPVEMAEIRPEFVRTVELGYRTFLTKTLMLDLNLYLNRYTDFIGSVDFVGPEFREVGTEEVALTPEEVAADSVDYFRRYINASEEVQSRGASVGLQWRMTQNFALNANYAYAEILSQEALGPYGLMTEFNTPPHKVNVGFSGMELDVLGKNRFGFGVNYRWQDAYLFQFGFGNGRVPAYGLVDAQVSYKLPKLRSVVQLGATNVLNNRHIEMFGGPTVGTMAYFQITYDEFLH